MRSRCTTKPLNYGVTAISDMHRRPSEANHLRKDMIKSYKSMLSGHVHERLHHLPLHEIRSCFSISKCVCLKGHVVCGAPIKRHRNVLRRCSLNRLSSRNHKTCERRFSWRAGTLKKRAKEIFLAVALHAVQMYPFLPS